MAIKKNIEEALNKQVNAEMYSAYLYLSMSADLESMNLKGFSNWMTVQAKEEMTHAMKIYRYVFERGGQVKLDKIDKPPSGWKNPLAAFTDSYSHEQKVTAMINDLVELSEKERDHATRSMLQWFVDEQVEEEANADEIVQKLKMVKNAPGGIFMLDRELGSRAFVDETAESKD